MRRVRPALAILLVLAAAQSATQTWGKPGAPAGFAEPSDIIAAEASFSHVAAAKGIKAAIRATAVPDAQVFAPQPMRVADYANSANLDAHWHTTQVWMSCDGSVAVTHGEWQRAPAVGWYITVWRRQKGGGYKWVLAQGGPLQTLPSGSDMIAASVGDCPARRAHNADAGKPGPPPAARGKAPALDHASGHADDATLAWATVITPDSGRTFTLQVRHDGVMREVLRASAAPPGA